MAKILRTLEAQHFTLMENGWELPYLDAAIISQSEPNMLRAQALKIQRPEVELYRYVNVLTKPLDKWHSPWFDFVHRYIPSVPNVRFPWFGNPEVWDWSNIGRDLQQELTEWMLGLSFPATRFFRDHCWEYPDAWMFDAPVEIDREAWRENITNCFAGTTGDLVNGSLIGENSRYLENAQAMPEPKRTELWQERPGNILSFNVDRCQPPLYAPYFGQEGWMAFTCDYPGHDEAIYTTAGEKRAAEVNG